MWVPLITGLLISLQVDIQQSQVGILWNNRSINLHCTDQSTTPPVSIRVKCATATVNSSESEILSIVNIFDRPIDDFRLGKMVIAIAYALWAIFTIIQYKWSQTDRKRI